MKERQFGYNEGQYVEFAAYDWRNKRITNISTDPVPVPKLGPFEIGHQSAA